MMIVFSPRVRQRLVEIEWEEGIPAVEVVHQAVEMWTILGPDDRRALGPGSDVACTPKPERRPKMTTFFTADTHFGHRNIVASCSRPFRDVDEMNDAIVERWNAIVRKRDEVYFLGDFGIGPVDYLETIFKRLRGRIHLIVGNHDKASISKWGWESVRQSATISVDGRRLFMSHYPHIEWPGLHRGAVHLFGHVHGQKPGVPGSCDVGVDLWNFVPVRLEEIMAKIEAPARDRPRDFLERLPGRTLQLLDRIEREWPAWARDAIAQSAERAINMEIDRVLEQVVAQGGFRDGEDDRE